MENRTQPVARLARFTATIAEREVPLRFTRRIMREFTAQTGKPFLDTSWFQDDAAFEVAIMLAAREAGGELTAEQFGAMDIEENMVLLARLTNMFSALEHEAFRGNLSPASLDLVAKAMQGAKVGDPVDAPAAPSPQTVPSIESL